MGSFLQAFVSLEGTLAAARGGVVPATLPVCAAHPWLVSLLFKPPQHATPCPSYPGSPGPHSQLRQSAQGTPTHKVPGCLSWRWAQASRQVTDLSAGLTCLSLLHLEPAALPLRGSPRSMPVYSSCGEYWRLTDCQGPLRLLCVGS